VNHRAPSAGASLPGTLRAQLLAAALAMALPGAHAQTPADCAGEPDSARRLACYDRLFRPQAEQPTGNESTPPAEPVTAPLANAAPSDERPETLLVSTFFTKAWELTPATKRGTFIVRTYLPNFVLPVHYSSSINSTPGSPTHPAGAARIHYRPVEAKLQVSLRAKVVQGLLLPDADLWLAFTQRSLWQVWNPQESSPFRSTDYQPEAIYVLPVPPRLGTLPGGWTWRMAQLGLAHQSNGQGEALSRSWNRVYAAAAFDHGEFGLTVRAHRRLKESANDDNPDLTHFIGSGEIVASWLPGLATSSLTWRTNLRSARRGSLQLDWTYPVSRAQPAGLRWYAQLFSGYGETLLDYNHRQTSLGLGLTLFQF
jgi:phospholipase A1/A2